MTKVSKHAQTSTSTSVPGLFSGSVASDKLVPKPVKITKENVLKALREVGTGWNEEFANLLSLPEHLYALQYEDASFYGNDDRIFISGIRKDIHSGTINAKKSDYGIAIYSTGGSVYFLLADISRKVVVLERIVCIHDASQPIRNWVDVRKNLESALSMAASEKDNFVVFAETGQKPQKLHLSSE